MRKLRTMKTSTHHKNIQELHGKKESLEKKAITESIFKQKKKLIIYYECNTLGYVTIDCPQGKRNLEVQNEYYDGHIEWLRKK